MPDLTGQPDPPVNGVMFDPEGAMLFANGDVLRTVGEHRASLRERVQMVGLIWRSGHGLPTRTRLRSAWVMARIYTRPSAQVASSAIVSRWVPVDPDNPTGGIPNT